MTKSLDTLSPEELGRLFPIILTEYDPQWAERYETEKREIIRAVGRDKIVRISHYGSASVPGIISKPTIDILLEVIDEVHTENLISSIINIGYLYDPQPHNPAPHMMFMKGYTPEGFAGQAYHIHVRYSGDWGELYFRDYLIEHPEVAVRYSDLKLRLMERYEFDREGYTRGKTEFITMITRVARKELQKF
nr:GrpB family protein [uncultured Methanospirillum sp.]